MAVLEVITILIVLAALCSFVNYRFIKLPNTIGVMVVAMAGSLLLVLLDQLGLPVTQRAERVLDTIDFNVALMHGMLAFLLFAGALHININDLASQKWVISSLATLGVIVSTFLVGSMSWAVLEWLDVNMPFGYCLLFGALISPTDPIAVMGIVKKLGAPKSLETKIAGESLFNDGVGVVVFLVLWHIMIDGHPFSVTNTGMLFLEEAVGGVLFGLLIGWITYLLLKHVDNYQVEVLLTLALVMGGYQLASHIHVSGPIAIVVAGLLIGNHGRRFAMSPTVREHLDTFWELIDEILNAVLFLLIGIEVLIIQFTLQAELAGLIMIPLVLLARWISVAGTIIVLKMRRDFTKGVIHILTWGGLRGGISVALALSLPASEHRPTILVMTYAVVVFSIIAQGLTIGPLVRRLLARK